MWKKLFCKTAEKPGVLGAGLSVSFFELLVGGSADFGRPPVDAPLRSLSRILGRNRCHVFAGFFFHANLHL